MPTRYAMPNRYVGPLMTPRRSLRLQATRRVAPSLAGLLLASTAQAEVVQDALETDHFVITIERVADGFANPWAVAFLPDGRYLVSERSGELNLVDSDGQTQVLEGMPRVSQNGQGGLLDVALHPEFGDGEHDWIYFTWSKPEGDNSRSALSRVKWKGDSLGDVEHLFVQDRASSPGRHYGSRLAWLKDGTLLMSIGDRGVDPSRAQASDDHAGSTLRLTETGEAPGDNPFVDDDDTLDEIYTMGNRNIQGMTVLSNGEPWATEHGPRTGDELNQIVPGNNYGWPEVTHGEEYGGGRIGPAEAPGFVSPVHDWTPSIASSGMAFYDGGLFPEWKGDLFNGSLKFKLVSRLELDRDDAMAEERFLEDAYGRIRDIEVGPDGALYLLTDSSDGQLLRLAPPR